MTLGANISKYRKQNNMTLEELASKLNVSDENISLWETDQIEPNINDLISMSDLFNISIDELCGKGFTSHKVEITYDTDFLKAYNSLFNMKRVLKTFIISIGIFIFGLFLILLSDSETIFFGLLFMIGGLIGVFSIFNNKDKTTSIQKDALIQKPNETYIFYFYLHYFRIEIKSTISAFIQKIQYKDIERVIEKEHYIFIQYLNKFYAISKESLGDQLNSVLEIIKKDVNHFKSCQNTRIREFSHKKILLIKTLSTITIIFAILTLPVALIILAYTHEHYYPSHFDPVNIMWVMLFSLPLPISSIVMGYIAKKRKMKYLMNVTLGIVMVILVLLFSSFSLVFKEIYTHDYTYVTTIEEHINYGLPDTGQIQIHDWTEGTQTTSDGSYVYHKSTVVFTNDDEIISFNISIKNSNLWTTKIDTANMGMLCTLASMNVSNYDYFMIYNKTLNLYNQLPNESGEYDFIFIAYKESTSSMIIIEYNYPIYINK